MNFLSSAVTTIKPRLDDFGTDRLNYYYSTMVIMILSITITARQYVGSPLQCWVPAQFTKAWEQYAENYCFVYNTYWVRPDDEVPESIDRRVAQQLIYYQWVPFIMALEAAFFYLPVIFWSQVNNRSGLNVENLVRLAVDAETSDDSERTKKVEAICTHLEESVQLQMTRRDNATLFNYILQFGQLNGTYVSNVYLITKILYVVNLIMQFIMMNKFLGQNDPYWGAHILSDILTGTDWELSGNFPRIAMCDFQVRVLGNFQRYSIQCVLSLNMFNEKIFLFLYFWFIAVGIVTVIDAVNLAYYTRKSSKKIQFIKKFIKSPATDETLMDDFCRSQVNADMMVILNMISAHANEVISSEILQKLWKNYRFIKSPATDETLMDDFCRSQVNADMMVILNMISAHANEVISSEILQKLWKNYRKRQITIRCNTTSDEQKINDNEESTLLMFA
ncbi:innexin-3 family protein [Dictyocaulus viviparus]|uniref:Innexin n=1 Tax=Dictyocaulus viviparus TaxID=29172 RepID=A0A0D8XP27_DICVI|nr:innexin-3 family protein [Dictyocaulus viviparus]